LRESIEVNEGIINPIWVQPLGDDQYIIIEGNTRLVIYKKQMSQRYQQGKSW